MTPHDAQPFIESIRTDAQCAERFAQIRRDGARLTCTAKDAAAPAQYTLEALATGWRIALSTGDRWLSESIESQLVESRDSLEDLFEEELKDLDCTGAAPKVRHFRDEEKQYVFECTLAAADETASSLALVRTYFLAFESTFRQLGDMSGADSH